jgi:hypothetical protein
MIVYKMSMNKDAETNATMWHQEQFKFQIKQRTIIVIIIIINNNNNNEVNKNNDNNTSLI